MAANKHRGEVAITLAGKPYVLRPTFQAQCEIEDLTGRGMMALLDRFVRRQFGARDVAAVLYAGMKAGGESGATFEKVGEMAVEDGLVNFTTAVGDFLTNAITGGEKPKPGEGGAGASGQT
jgi:hypothetical protein